VPNKVCAHFKELGDYDYRPTREVADADERHGCPASVIDVDSRGYLPRPLYRRAQSVARPYMKHPFKPPVR